MQIMSEVIILGCIHAGMVQSIGNWGGGGGKEIFDQLASHFPQFDQLLSYCVIKNWSMFDHSLVKIDQIVYQKDIINIPAAKWSYWAAF